jgi:hypothetical protein
MKVNFHSVFEAEKAAKLFGWERHHNYGSLEFEVTDLKKLKGIGYWIE